MKRYRQRYFRLQGSILYYYVDDDHMGPETIDDHTKPRGTIYLSGARITVEPPRPPIGAPAAPDPTAGATAVFAARSYPFVISHSSSAAPPVKLATDSEELANTWVRFLCQAAQRSHLSTGPGDGRVQDASPARPALPDGHFRDVDITSPSYAASENGSSTSLSAFMAPPQSAPPLPPGTDPMVAEVLREGAWTALVSEPLEDGGGVLGGNKNVATVSLRLVRRAAQAQGPGGATPAAGWAEGPGRALANWGVSVQRREKDFGRLHDYLSHEVGASSLPRLPSKQVFGAGAAGDARYRDRLQTYLDCLLALPAARRSNALKVFLTGTSAPAAAIHSPPLLPRFLVSAPRSRGERAARAGTKVDLKQPRPREPNFPGTAAMNALPDLSDWASFAAEEAFLAEVFASAKAAADSRTDRCAAARTRAMDQSRRQSTREAIIADHRTRLQALRSRAPAQEARLAAAQERAERQRLSSSLAFAPEPADSRTARDGEAPTVKQGVEALTEAEQMVAHMAGRMAADQASWALHKKAVDGAAASAGVTGTGPGPKVGPVVHALLNAGAPNTPPLPPGAPTTWARRSASADEPERLRLVRGQRARLEAVLKELSAAAGDEAQDVATEGDRLSAEARAAEEGASALRFERQLAQEEARRREQEAAAIAAEAAARADKEKAITQALAESEAAAAERHAASERRAQGRRDRRRAAEDGAAAARTRADARARRADDLAREAAAAMERMARAKARLQLQQASKLVIAFGDDARADAEARARGRDVLQTLDSAVESDAAACAEAGRLVDAARASASADRAAAQTEARTCAERLSAPSVAMEGPDEGADAADDVFAADMRRRRRALKDSDTAAAAALEGEQRGVRALALRRAPVHAEAPSRSQPVSRWPPSPAAGRGEQCP